KGHSLHSELARHRFALPASRNRRRCRIEIVWIHPVTTDTARSASERERACAHVTAAGWGKGVRTLWRIVRMALRHPWQVALAIVATFRAAGMQLLIPRLLGQAVDQAHGIFTEGAAAQEAL